MKKLFAIILTFSCLLGTRGSISAQTISTVVGTGATNFTGDGILATNANINQPYGVAVDRQGNIYIAERAGYRIRRVDAATGTTSTVAGIGVTGYSGDGGPAIAATFNFPNEIIVAGNGDLYIADTGNNCVRKVVAASGNIFTYAGTGTAGNTGDNGPAIAAQLNNPYGLALLPNGDLLVGDELNNRIRLVEAATGNILPYAGTGVAGHTGDGGPATAATFNGPRSLVLTPSGDVYVAEGGNNCIRRITAGVVTTVAGTGVAGFSGDGGPATNALLNFVHGIQVHPNGSVFFSDSSNNRIRMVDGTGIITTFAGTGTAGSTGDGGPATNAQLNVPYGIAFDSNTNLLVADRNSNKIRRITIPAVPPAQQGWSVLAGPLGSAGFVDGPVSVAQFASPSSISFDASGNLYVLDSNAQTIRKLTPGGVVTTLAGQTSTTGKTNGVGTAALFFNPQGLVADSAGNVYVADASNHTIRQITPGGVVSTLAGLANQPGTADGTGATARFHHPVAVALDASGNLYVSDQLSHTIRQISSGGVVTTLAGQAGVPGNADGTGPTAQFNTPAGLAVDNSGNVYVADLGNSTIRQIAPGGVVTTLVGSPGVPGSADGTGNAALFNGPQGVAVDSIGTLYVVDSGNQTIRKITAGGVVTTFAGQVGVVGRVNGNGTNALFQVPQGICVDNQNNVYVAEIYPNTIRRITPTADVTTYAGVPPPTGAVDGTGGAARFYSPQALATDSAGNLYVADYFNHSIRQIAAGAAVSTIAGTPTIAGSTDGPGGTAQFKNPSGVATDQNGNIYVADSGNATIRVIAPGGLVSTLAGTAGLTGSANGIGAAARFSIPYGIAVDATGAVYVADAGNSTIRKITPAGLVSTIAGSAGRTGSSDGTGTAALFSGPRALTVDAAGNIYVSDSNNNRIRKIDPAGVVTTVNSTVGQLTNPLGVIVDTSGNLYVADEYDYCIKQFAPGGTVTVLGGHPSFKGSANGPIPNSWFFQVSGIVFDSAGNLVVADQANNNIRRLAAAAAATTTLTGTVRNASTGNGLPGVSISVGSSTAISDASGNFAISNLAVGPILVIATNTGYVGLTNALTLTNSPTNLFNFTMSPTIAGTNSLRIVLTWNAQPRDLDSYTLTPVIGGSAQEISFFNKGSLTAAPFVQLDVDNTSGFGPETTTITNLFPGTYEFYVNNFTGTPILAGCGAKVQVYSAAGLIQTVTVPATGTGDYWRVLQIDGGSGQITVLNTITNNQPTTTVPLQPTIFVQPSNMSQAFGGTALFSVTADGVAPLSYQWKKNTVNIPGATSASLVLTNLQAGDAGSYSVVLTNPNGTTNSLPATLAVGIETVTPAGLVAHWKFDEAPGSLLAVDSVGNYNGLLSTNGAAFVAGTNGNAISLTATANGLVSMGNNLSMTTQDFTVAAWIKTAPGDTKSFANFLSKHEANFDDGYILTYNHPVFANGANHAFFYASSRTLPNGQVDVPLSTAAVNDGNWHLIVGVYRASGNTSIYVDGSPAQGSITSTPLTPNTAPFLIGGVAISTVPTAMYSGLVDDVQFYKRALADSEIDFLFNNPGLAIGETPGTAPVITTQPVSKTSYLGSNVTFSATVSGQPPLAYQWFFNSTPLSNATNTVLPLFNVQTNQAGYYSLVISNSLGSVTSSIASLTVFGLGVPVPTITTIVGSGLQGFNADGILATNAGLNLPYDVTLDALGNIYIADYQNTRIRKVTASTGLISTVAGTGANGFSGDNGPATSARLTKPAGVFRDAAGNLYISDTGNNRIRKVTPAGVITTIAGTGTGTYGGDGAAATLAQIASPNSALVDAAGNVFIADYANDRIRKIDAANGTISTFAGTSPGGFSGDGGPATAAQINGPTGMAMDAQGNLYFSDLFNNRVRRVDANGIITTVAGSGLANPVGDGLPATNASLSAPRGLAFDSFGRLFIADATHNRIRVVDTNGIISTYAGTGTAGFSGDGGPAAAAQLNYPSGVQVDANGAVYVTDQNNNRIRRIISIPFSPASGLVAYYSFNGNANDVTGHGANGTPANVTYGPDRFSSPGGAAVFAGDFTSFSDITSTNLNLTQDFTISGWFNFTANAGTDNPRIISSSGYVLTTQTTGLTRSIGFANYGTNNSSTINSAAFPAGSWIHAVGVRAAGQMTLYVNGGIQGTLAANFPLDYSRGLPEIGGNFLSTADNFGGSIDDLRIYNRALTSYEVTELFQLESSPTVPVVTNQPVSQAVHIGSNATFSVSAVGAAPLAYQWYFNGNAIPGANSASLVVPNVSLANVGYYSVVTSNLFGATPSFSARLNLSGQGAPIPLFLTTNDVSNFTQAGGPVTWTPTPSNTLAVVPGTGNIQSTQTFGDFILHAEFLLPPTGNGNGGIYLQGRYEVQIFNSFGVSVLGSNDCGAIWGKTPPSANACRPAGQWQSYDITFRQAQWNGNTKFANARATVVLNGVTVQNNVAITGPTQAGAPEGPSPGPVVLQDNGTAVQFRNVTIIPLDTPPDFAWAVRAGATNNNGSNGDFGKGITRDRAGNVFVVGQYQGTANFGPTNISGIGNAKDMFLAKYDAAGNFQWVSSFGGSFGGEAYAVKTDALGSIYVAGRWDSRDTLGQTNLINTGGVDAFLAKFDAQGNLIWWQQAGASGATVDYAIALALDSAGNPIIGGLMLNNAAFGTTTLTAAGANDAYVAKYDPAGNLQWARALGGGAGARTFGVACDPADNILVGGYYAGSIQAAPGFGGTDAFIAKFDPNGTQLWLNVGGGAGDDSIEDVASDAQGNVLVTGKFSTTATFGPTTLTSTGGADSFTAKYDQNGNQLWIRQRGGSGEEDIFGADIATDPLGNIYVTGAFQNTATFSATSLTSAGDNDVHVTKYAPDGTQLWVQRFGDVGYDHARGLVVDETGSAFVTGAFNGTVNAGATTLVSAGGNDIFTFKLGSTPPVVTTPPMGGNVLAGQPLTLTAGVSNTIGAVTYQWRFNGTNIVGATNATLTLASVTTNAAGNYDVLVSHAFGSTVSAPAAVTVANALNPLNYEWAVRAGSSVTGGSGDFGKGISVTPAGEILVTGQFNGTASFGTTNLSTAGGIYTDIFVARYNSKGVAQQVSQIAGMWEDMAFAVQQDAAGNVFIGGRYDTTGILGSLGLVNNGGFDGIVAKFDPAGSLLWIQQFGASSAPAPGLEHAVGLTLDPAGNPVIVGTIFANAKFGSTTVTLGGTQDGFLAKYDSAGALQWVHPIGSTAYGEAFGVTSDRLGNLYVCGYFTGSLMSNGVTIPSAGSGDCFVAKYNAAGTLVWMRTAGGTGQDWARDIALDPQGNVVVTGTFQNTVNFGQTTLTSVGGDDVFVAKYDNSGTLLWARSGGGPGDEDSFGGDLTTDQAGNIYISGAFQQTAQFGNITVTSAGSDDVFVAKYSADGSLSWVHQFGGTGFDHARGIAVDGSGSVFVTGAFDNSVTAGTNTLTSAGGHDAFVFKLAAIPPAIANQPASQTVSVNQPATFTVAATGTGPLAYQWSFNGTNIPGATNSSFILPNVIPTMAGNYAVRVNDSLGITNTAPATLTVDTSGVPFIVTPPLTQTVPQGVAVTLNVSATGGQPLSYQWRKDGTNFAGQIYNFLPLGGATINTAGSYTVVVTNTFGAVTSAPAVISVIQVFPPVVTNPPLSQIVTAGTNVTFSVACSGTPPFNYQWVFGGVAIPNNDQPTLTITNVSLADAGNYFVQVFNSAGLDTSATARLTVQTPPTFVSIPTDATILQGGTNNFTAIAVASPPPGYQWYKNGVRLTNSANYANVTSTNLLVFNAQAAQSGSYLVVVTNGVGSITSAPVTLTVLLAPVITTHPTNVTLLRTNANDVLPVTLSVAASGAAPLLYQWRFNGGDLPNETNTTLTLTNVTRLSNGLYSATVTNVAGSAVSSNALLRVRVPQQVSPPVFTPGAPFRLRFGDADGGLAGPVDFSNLIVQATTNVLRTNTVWVTLTNGFSVVNGMIQFDDPSVTNLTHRYYRVIER